MLNENLSKVRKERGLTQEALAIKLNVVRQTVSKWEKGTAVPDADTLCKIADALEVSTATLLGNSQFEDQDQESITKALAQINEQLAIRNRHSAIVWKVLCLIALVVIAILLGKNHWEINNENSKNHLPDTIEVSGLRFSCNGKELNCFFIPSVGDENISYTITLSYNDQNIPDIITTAQYKNGICTASFDKSKIYGHTENWIVLSIKDHNDIRNVPLANNLSVHGDNCSWQNDVN